MPHPPVHQNEPQRLQTLRALDLLDTPLEERFERITRMACRLLQAPIAGVSLVDAGRVWFKSIQGLNIIEVDRDSSFCAHAIVSDEVLVVPDATADPRFAQGSLVAGEPYAVAYAGCPVRFTNGLNVGALFVLETAPRDFSDRDVWMLHDLAALVERELSASAVDPLPEMTGRKHQDRRRAMIDPVTRTWNRQGILRALDLQLTDDTEYMFAVAALRIDDEPPGGEDVDEMRCALARRCLGGIRSTDILGRLDAGEFLLVTGPVAGARQAIRIGERLCMRMTAEPVACPGGPRAMSLSIGLAIIEPDAKPTAEAVLAMASAAAQEARAAGGNTVRVAEAPAQDHREVA
ncbi:MAG: GGDEF domain-containing protein [Phycisphaerales bacterium JB039]